MFWKKKKKMIDLSQLQRRGVVRIPQNEEPLVATNKEGFVELGSSQSSPALVPESTPSESSASSMFGFLDSPSSSSGSVGSVGSVNSISPALSGNLRKISNQISDLDNKLYKLEQRIELIERKLSLGG